MILVTTDCISNIDDWMLARNACDIIPWETRIALNPKVKQQKEMVQEFMALKNCAEKQTPQSASKGRAVDPIQMMTNMDPKGEEWKCWCWEIW